MRIPILLKAGGLLAVLALAGCAAATPILPTQSAASPIPTLSLNPSTVTTRATETMAASATLTAAPSTIPTETPIPDLPICSPLQGITLAQMPEILQGPLQTPHPGQDDGHHGDDFAFYQFGSIKKMEGLPVQAVLPGIVAAIANDRLPYGNMIIIETPLEQIPPSWLSSLPVPTPSPAMTVDPRMQNCPAAAPTLSPSGVGRSVYLLYAHLRLPTTLKPGQAVNCGQPLGEVGNTGLSGNPHLHLEMRIGPAGARFSSMAYYDPRASAEEFANYCTWRVSQLFQLMDPLDLLKIGAH